MQRPGAGGERTYRVPYGHEELDIVRRAKLRAAADVEEALEIAYLHIGRPARASVLLVPRALHTLPVLQAPSVVA